MSIELPLDTMTVAEKVQLLETVWDSLCRESGDVHSAGWSTRRRNDADESGSGVGINRHGRDLVTPPEETGGNREYKLRPPSQRPNPTRRGATDE